MTFRHSAIWLIIATLLGSYIWYFEHPLRERSQQAKLDLRLFPELRSTDITGIQLQQGTNRVQISRTATGWTIQEPINFPAEPEKVGSFIAALSGLEYQTSLPPTNTNDETEDPYGLNASHRSLVINSSNADFELTIGAAVAGGVTFVRRSGSDSIYAIARETFDNFSIQPDKWRDPRLFPYPADEITRIRIDSPLSSASVTRDRSELAWNLEAPLAGARVFQPSIAQFLQQLSEIRIADFITPTEEQTQISLKLSNATGLDYELAIQGPHPENSSLFRAYLPRQETAITVPKAFVDQVLDPELIFRSTYLLDFGYEFETLEVKGENSFTLTRDKTSGEWWITKPRKFLADPLLVTEFLRQLAELYIVDFITDEITSESEFGLDFPFLSFTFSRSDNSTPPLNIRFGFKIQNHLLTHRSDETSIYAVPFGAVDLLPKAGFLLRDRRLWSMNSETITSVKVKQGENKTILWTKEGSLWNREQTPLAQVESAAFTDLISELSAARAEAWITRNPNTLKQLGFGKRAALSIDTLINGETIDYTLEFGSMTARGNHYAMTSVSGTPTIFEFPGSLYVKLNQIFGLEPRSQP